jgi:hypothetical protein
LIGDTVEAALDRNPYKSAENASERETGSLDAAHRLALMRLPPRSARNTLIGVVEE